jgi:hypothetical protein
MQTLQPLKLNVDHWVSPDGVESLLVKAGEVVHLPLGVAAGLIERGIAEAAEYVEEQFTGVGEAKDAGDADENKDAGAADENKTGETKPVTLEDLLKLTRAELDAAAAKAGVENPGELSDKRAVAEAIMAKEASA